MMKEENKRQSWHGHVQERGGLTPALIAHVAHVPALMARVARALETQVVAELPLAYHAVVISQKKLPYFRKRRDGAAVVPRVGANFVDTKTPAFIHHARLVRVDRHDHEHQRVRARVREAALERRLRRRREAVTDDDGVTEGWADRP